MAFWEPNVFVVIFNVPNPNTVDPIRLMMMYLQIMITSDMLGDK
jgi:hypothetical protein